MLSCHGYEITTIEGIGNRKDGYHEIQNQIAKFSGSLCGSCSPGMVMAMYSLLKKSNNRVTMQSIESSMDGHFCRYTGYRSVLDAFKCLATDADQVLLTKSAEIEDLGKICSKSRKTSKRSYSMDGDKLVNQFESIYMKFMDTVETEWFKVISLQELFVCFNDIGEKDYQLVTGNMENGENLLSF